MKYRKELLPVIFLGSGTALTVCGLAMIVAYGTRAPIAALALLLAGLLDGGTGLIWTVAVLFSRKDETPERIDEARRSLVLASGLLAVIFLGAVLALLLYLHVIVGYIKSWQLL
jgi:hypothetical protein